MEVSKTKSSFYRRLYVAWLIDSQTAASVPASRTTSCLSPTSMRRWARCWMR